MADIRPFRAVRPAEGLAGEIAALPYDVYDEREAREETLRSPLSHGILPAVSGGKKLSKDDIFRKDDRGRYVMGTAERQRAIAENLDAFSGGSN